jgi:hypothetical protein
MDPNIWGPKLWFVIHTFALNFPKNPSYDDIRTYEEFFNNLKSTIPCYKCKIHYTEELEKNPIINYLTDTETLFKYTVDFHNIVNKRLKKKTYNYNEAYKIYIDAYSKDKKDKIKLKVKIKQKIKKLFYTVFNKKTITIYTVIIIMILLYLYYRKKTFFRVIKV